MLEKDQEIKPIFIKYIFTREELEKVASDLAEKYTQRQSLIDKKKEITSALSAEVNACEASLSQLAREHSQGYKRIYHDCYEVFDYDAKQVYIYRADNDEKVDNRIMTSTEFQADLFSKKEKIKELPEQKEIHEAMDEIIDEVENLPEDEEDDTEL